MSRRHDAALATLVLAPVLAASVAAGATPDPTAAGVGVAGAVVTEAALTRRRAVVRRVWARPTVRGGAVLGAFGGAALATTLVGPRALVALVAGLAAYLALLGAVTARERLRARATPTLRRRAAGAVCGAVAATGAAGVGVAAAAGTAAAVRWGAVAVVVLGAYAWFLGTNLGANRAGADAPLRPRVGVPNLVTLGRGTLVAWLAGFVAVPWAGGPFAVAPAALYGASVALDWVDGTLARRLDQVSTLGARMDAEFDGAGILVAVVVAVAGGVVAAPLLVVGLVNYAYAGAEWLARRRGRQLAPLPERRSRRLLAALQMCVLAVVLVPAVAPPGATLATAAVGGAYVAGFVRDWRLR